MCTDTKIEKTQEGFNIDGEATEVAITSCALRNNKNKNDLYINMKRVNELPFDSDRKMMTTVHLVNGKYRVITKGAPDVLLKRCTKYYDNGNIV